MPALIVLAYGSLLILSMLDNLRGPFFPELIGDLHLNGTASSAFFAVTNLFSFLGSWTSHRILRSKSSLQLMAASSVFVGLGFAGIALSPKFGWLMVGCMVFGWAYGALNLAQNVMVFEGSSPVRRRQLFSGLHSMYGLASLLAPLMASAFLDTGLSWRQAFLIMGVFPALTPLLLKSFHTPPPPQEKNAEELTRREWLLCLIFSSMMAGYLWGEISASSRLVLWLRTDLAFTPEKANLYLSGFFLALLAGRTLFTLVRFPKCGNWRILTASAGLSALTYALGLRYSPLWMVAAGLMMAPFFPVAMEQVSCLFHKKSAQALGFIIGFGSLSVVVMHMTVGMCTDFFGISRALIIGPTTMAMVFIALTGAQMAGRLQQ